MDGITALGNDVHIAAGADIGIVQSGQLFGGDNIHRQGARHTTGGTNGHGHRG